MVQPHQEQAGDLVGRKQGWGQSGPCKRRALGELTNTPLLLSPGGGGLSSLGLSPLHSPRLTSLNSPNELLAPPDHISTPPKTAPGSPDTVTPTHNLKLLTELASKLPGAGLASSARQTLQFEDFPSSQLTGLNSDLVGPSPHRDHTYGNKGRKGLSQISVLEETIETNNGIRLAPVAPNSINKLRQMKPESTPDSELFAPPAERGNRKEKSLGLLAERMLASLPHSVGGPGEPAREIQLDDTARALQTERRRIYDIVNVLEAVQMMSKVGKNVYQWHGRTYLVQSLAWLRQLGMKLGMVDQYNAAREQEMQLMIHNQENVNIENVSPNITPLTPNFSPMASPSPLNSPLMSPYGSPNDPNGTSMGINTQKFLMLFLVSPSPQTLTLDFAARVIHGIHQIEKTRLTRIRRLYDIANILQSLGLIRKVQVTDGRGKKPAFQYIGPDVTSFDLSEEEKRQMPATRQKNSLLAVGRNLAVLPDKETPSSPSLSQAAKRARSLSEERRVGQTLGQQPAKLQRTRSESRLGEESQSISPSLFDLSEVCERERQKLEKSEPGDSHESPVPVMKPPTPGRPPSRKKHLLQRYYSDSALLSSSQPRMQGLQLTRPEPLAVRNTSAIAAHTFTSPQCMQDNHQAPLFSQRDQTPFSPPASRPYQPIPLSPLSVSRASQRSILIPSCSNAARTITLSNPIPQSPRSTYSPLHPSPLTKSSPQTVPAVPVSPRTRTPMRSPITPRDLRNSSILPPHSPTNPKLITCSPMGPVGRSLLSSPASPRAPMDLTTRPSRHGRSPLASRALNLPPSPGPQMGDLSSHKTHTLLKSTGVAANENTSPLLRAYLASNKNRIFKPIISSHGMEGVSILPLDNSTEKPLTSMQSPASSISTLSLLPSQEYQQTSNPLTPATDTNTSSTPSPEGSSNSSTSSATSELEGIFGKSLPRPPPRQQVQAGPGLSDKQTPLDFSRLLSAPACGYLSSSTTSFSLGSEGGFLTTPTDLYRTPTLDLQTPTNTTSPPDVSGASYGRRY